MKTLLFAIVCSSLAIGLAGTLVSIARPELRTWPPSEPDTRR